MSTETKIPTLTTVNAAIKALQDLSADHDWVSVFWDKGWGDTDTEISIIVDGNGQQPKARITSEVYVALLDQQVIPENTLNTYKARKLHDYRAPALVEEAGPNPSEVAEQVIRAILAGMAGMPVRAQFYRGLERSPRGPNVLEEIVEAGSITNRRVLLLPGAYELAISAQERDILGWDIIGGGLADVIAYPGTEGGDVDVEALAGAEFRATLVAAIDAKLDEVTR